MGKLDGRVAIVTGGAQGIGRAIVDKLADEGATVVIGDIDGDKAEAAAKRIGGLAITADIAEPEQAANLVDTTVERYGKLDVLVNNAAIVPFTAWDATLGDMRHIRKLCLRDAGSNGDSAPAGRRR